MSAMLPTSSGDAVVAALDHGLSLGVYEQFEDPQSTLETVLEGRPDGIIAGVPFLRQLETTLADYPDLITIATVDQLHDSTLPGQQEDAEIHHQVFNVEEAARIEADAIKTALVYGREEPNVLAENLRMVADVSETARSHGMDSIVEPTLWGQRIKDEFNGEYLTHANRIGFEIGAEILKSPFPSDPEAFESIVENAPIPVYIAGGPTVDDEREVFEMVRTAMDAGANGVMFGRNIWQRDDPAATIRAMKNIVHEDASVDRAMKHLR